jgi:alpha-glutamyl/putrescinyl thymine pyrophosphorylase clade 1
LELLNANEYFAAARERYWIWMQRQVNQPPPWTNDLIFRYWRFTNVHREDDKTTVWFRENIRDPLNKSNLPWVDIATKLTFATVTFRWFNRIETGERIKDLLLEKWDTEEARRRLTGIAPVVTGAYIIKGPDNYSKLDGVLHCIDEAIPTIMSIAPLWGKSLREAWEDLVQIYYLGPFMSYEVVSDLRWTKVLEKAEDINTWCNMGPGATRGLTRVCGGGDRLMFDSNSKIDQETMLFYAQELLAMSKKEELWPKSYKPWEMREVEHWLCEFDKYKKGQLGFKLKRRYA